MSMMVMSHINIHTGPCVSVIDSTCRYDEPRSSWPFDDECRAAAEQLPGPLRHVTDRQTDSSKKRATYGRNLHAHSHLSLLSVRIIRWRGPPDQEEEEDKTCVLCTHHHHHRIVSHMAVAVTATAVLTVGIEETLIFFFFFLIFFRTV